MLNIFQMRMYIAYSKCALLFLLKPQYNVCCTNCKYKMKFESLMDIFSFVHFNVVVMYFIQKYLCSIGFSELLCVASYYTTTV